MDNLKISNVTFKAQTVKAKSFKSQPGVVAYPEYKDIFVQNNNCKSDTCDGGVVKALVSKLTKAYNILFSEDITAKSSKIKNDIDSVFEYYEGERLNTVA